MNLREVRKRVASIIYVSFILNAQFYGAETRYLNATYKQIKYRNLLQAARETNEIAHEIIEELKSKFLFGYRDRGFRPVCNVTYRRDANMTEKEKLLEDEKKLSVFIEPLNKITTEIRTSQANAIQLLNNLTLVCYKFIDLLSRVKYVASHVRDQGQDSNKNKPNTPKTSTFSQPPGTSLGNRVVSLLECLKQELFYSSRLYHDEIKEIKNTKYTFR